MALASLARPALSKSQVDSELRLQTNHHDMSHSYRGNGSLNRQLGFAAEQ